MSVDAPDHDGLADLSGQGCEHAGAYDDGSGACVACQLEQEHDRERAAFSDLTDDGNGRVRYL